MPSSAPIAPSLRQVGRTLGDRGVELVDLLVDDPRQAARPLEDRHRHQAEELRPHAALAHPGQVQVARPRPARQRRLVVLVHVVAPPAGPHERVGVQVDGRVLRVESLRLL
jgi:hypothetical protein